MVGLNQSYIKAVTQTQHQGVEWTGVIHDLSRQSQLACHIRVQLQNTGKADRNMV